MAVKLICEIGALTSPEQLRRQELAGTLFADMDRIEELDNGYSVRLDPRQVREAAEFASLESRCCAFLDIVASEELLQITGPPGTKEFLKSALAPRTL